MKQTKLVKALVGMTFGGTMLVAGASAFAATADFTVKGTVIPASCNPTFDGDGKVDFGTIQASSLKDADYTTLTAKPVILTVTCSAPMRMDFGVVDNKTASSLGSAVTTALGVGAATYVYGLGATTINGQSVSLGSYAIKVNGKPTVDGTAASFNYAVADSGQGYSTAATAIIGNGTQVYTAATNNGTTPGKVFVYPLTIAAVINKGSLLPLNGEVDLDGQATFTIGYW
ncbi:DUF1120 domain-containing protein [Trinickia sp. YCB016]